MDVKILLVDDHDMVRSGLRVLLEKEPGLRVVGEASDGRKAVKMVHELSVDVVVMDLRLPDLNGIEAARQTIAARPGIKVIGLSGVGDERSAVEMLRAGASGYVVKDSAFEELVTAIDTVMKGDVFISPSVAGLFLGDYLNRGDRAKDSAFSVLSPREREVLQLIAEGKATKQVAAQLSVSVKTAETHRRNLMEKLNVDNVAELTKYAIREGLTGL